MIRLIVPVFLCLWTTPLQAQYRDFAFEKDSSLWLSTMNGAGLTRFTGTNITAADVYGQLQRGGFVNYSESPKTTEAGASVESFCRLSARTVVYGRMSYDNFTGRDMAGSAFVCPDRRPFDIVEDSVTNLGRKHRDTYNLVGAVGVDLWRGLSVGGRVAYTSANYAKYKDLRHKNLFMNLDVAAGLTLPLGRSVTLGANYFYRRNTESLEFSTYGKGDKVYKSLVAYAVFTGRVEQFGGDGFTDSNTSMPLLDEHHGMAAQLELRPSGAFAWYHEASMAWREGYYGRRSPYTIQYTRHDSKLYTYRTRLSYRRPSAIHHLDLSLEAENLQNKLNTYRELTNDAGSHYYEYYDPVKAANKVWVSGSVAYTGYLGVVGRPANGASPSSARIGTGAVGVASLPTWTLHAAFNWKHRKQTAYVYPYYRRQKLDVRELRLGVARNIFFNQSMLTLEVGAAFSKGSGVPFEENTFIEPSDKQSTPPTMEAWLYREYEYLTAAQHQLSLGAKYSFIIPTTAFPAYVAVNIGHRKAHRPDHREFLSGTDHTLLRLSVGTVF